MNNERDVESTLFQAQEQLKAGNLTAALQTAQDVLVSSPENIDALYIIAVAQRYQNQFSLALKTLLRLRKIAPEFGRAYQEEGHNCIREKKTPAAIQAYSKAVQLNPALISSWKSLLDLHTSEGNIEAARIAKRQHSRLSQLPGVLVSVASHIHEKAIYKAERLCRDFLKTNPHHTEAMRLLADIGVKLHIYDDAEFLLESCLEFESDNRIARYDYVNVLLKRQKYEMALRQAGILCDLEPDNIAFQGLYANACVTVGRQVEAVGIYTRLLERAPNKHSIYLSRGHCLKTIGKVDEAISSYRRSYLEKPNFGDAFWSLANLKTYRFTDEEIQIAETSEQSGDTLLNDRFHLCFALGKAYEDRADFDRSFLYYERGNALKKKQLRYNADQGEKELKIHMEICTPAVLQRGRGSGCPAPDPIFIVGLPRAGSTLLEQILSSHSQVDGTFELPNMMAIAHRLNGRQFVNKEARYPKILSDLPLKQLQALGDEYITGTRIHRGKAPYFIDKMPNNFRHIGLISMILPDARIIDARRHPMGCCFSGFKQLFAEGQDYTYGLEEIGRYYRNYVELMDHWDEVLPGKVLRVQYEDVVADLEGEVRRLVDYCELSFETSCIDFYKAERAVRTPSSEQVRQPIYQSGIDQWQNYQEYLGPLVNALGPVLDNNIEAARDDLLPC